ncbi:unnamed protein product, partial [Rangifer tarandus platyrhynchus]
EHRKSLPICPLFSSLLLQHQIDWLRLLVGPCGRGDLHEPLLQAKLRLSQACQAPLYTGFSRQDYWSGNSLLQGFFLTQKSNPHLLCLLHWQADSLPLLHLGS